jgi:hypothetical protein
MEMVVNDVSIKINSKLDRIDLYDDYAVIIEYTTSAPSINKKNSPGLLLETAALAVTKGNNNLPPQKVREIQIWELEGPKDMAIKRDRWTITENLLESAEKKLQKILSSYLNNLPFG